MTYTKAYNELQKIVENLKGEDISIDDMKKHILKAKKLITFCQQKLRDIEADLEGDSLED